MPDWPSIKVDSGRAATVSAGSDRTRREQHWARATTTMPCSETISVRKRMKTESGARSKAVNELKIEANAHLRRHRCGN